MLEGIYLLVCDKNHQGNTAFGQGKQDAEVEFVLARLISIRDSMDQLRRY